jgi:hypothetical protein
MCSRLRGVHHESNIRQAIDRTVAHNIVFHVSLRVPLKVVEYHGVFLSHVKLVGGHQGVDGVVSNVRQKICLLQCLNKLCNSSRELSSSLGA